MKVSCRGVALILLLGAACGAAMADGAKPIAPPLWGTLTAGHDVVGFHRTFVFDRSRTWIQTRAPDGTFTPDRNGRPIQINVWYPAVPTKSDAMRLGDYVEQNAPAEFSDLNHEMLLRNRDAVGEPFTADATKQLLAMPMAGHLDAKPTPQRPPLILLAGGLSADINVKVVLAEYLASHGYAVASVSLLGHNAEEMAPFRSSANTEAGVRDLEFAIALLCQAKDVDCDRIGVAGHSLGAVQAVLLGQRNGNVAAVIAMDGTYAFKGNESALTAAYGFDPKASRYALLDLRRKQGMQSADLNFAPIDGMRYADRTYVQLNLMHHSDFTSFSMTADAMHLPTKAEYNGTGWTRATARQGYEQSSRIALAFLNQHVLGDPTAATQLSSLLQSGTVASSHHENALAAPPRLTDVVTLAQQGKAASIKSMYQTACAGEPMEQCVDQDAFNNRAYDELKAKRPEIAMVLFDLVAWSHPASANAQDSLADGYLALGQKDGAREASRKELALLDGDPSLDGATRQRLRVAAEKRLKDLQ
ncbi:pimeloyl-ACP methyl ester carboxylesterase [Dyella sp. SG562]|uniref:alpha/beta fold hydrolase n=1 Tax=Dyella sp. SG562 TaxID=2587017 RepID=UPI001420B3FD|nr:alpha/beta fold hydrolase [Dyella sp. SG562]NII74466.1 pimeloyl-ACP methyl ester carboxylesterase [Dyella sp. SG562]